MWRPEIEPTTYRKVWEDSLQKKTQYINPVHHLHINHTCITSLAGKDIIRAKLFLLRIKRIMVREHHSVFTVTCFIWVIDIHLVSKTYVV